MVLPESASQTRAVVSPEAVTTRLPSGLNAAELTPSDRCGVPLEGGEGLAGVGVPDPPVLSAEAVTTRLPSGLNAAELTTEVCPWRVARVLPESGVPDPRRVVP